ncbi:EAL domain-containing protein [Telluria aromaticivorans]|uniref:EAL domain-containing protein n=1 Tax=Telluria aromaticivorans TaxID=2725995 RepID=UPI003FCE4129
MPEPPLKDAAAGDGVWLARALRAHRTISASNRTLLRVTDERQLLHDRCAVAVEQGGYVRTGVIYADHGPARRLQWMAWMGREDGRGVAIDIDELNAAGYTWADTPLGQDATAIAIRTGKPFTRRDVTAGPVFQDPAYDALRRRAEQGGYRSLTAIPLACGDEMIGALFMAAAEPDAFDEQEISLLGELADDLAFGIHTLRLRREHEQAQETIRRLTLFDTLTGLPNRAGMFQLLRERIEAARAAGRPLAIVHIGVGRFHEIGNALGFGAIEGLMKVLAARLVASVPEGTPVVMPGEGEFAIFLDDAGLEGAVSCARTALDLRSEPVEVSSALIAPRLAVGISLFPEHASTAESLARRASAAMRLAQRSAVGIAVYPAGHEQEIAERLAMMGRLPRATEHGELEMYCQPKVDMRTHRTSGAEALIRWRDPERGLISPATFIPVAEQAGMISVITEWMVQTAFRQVHAWNAAGCPSSLSVNLSAHDIQDPAFIEHVRHLALSLAIPDNSIQFAIAGAPEGHGLRDLDRRFRHRLFQPQLPAALPDPCDQDRPVLRAPDERESRLERHRARHHRSGTPPGAACRCRGRRGPGGLAVPGGARLRCGAGLFRGQANAGHAVRRLEIFVADQLGARPPLRPREPGESRWRCGSTR